MSSQQECISCRRWPFSGALSRLDRGRRAGRRAAARRLRDVRIVGDHHDRVRPASCSSSNSAMISVDVVRVEVAGGLVGEEHRLGFVGQGPGDRGALALAAGQLVDGRCVRRDAPRPDALGAVRAARWRRSARHAA